MNRIVVEGRHNGQLLEDDQVYFDRANATCHRITQFYITMKIHSTPIKSRPVSGAGGTYIAAVSKWVDAKLQPLMKHSPVYIKNTLGLINRLKDLGQLERGT